MHSVPVGEMEGKNKGNSIQLGVLYPLHLEQDPLGLLKGLGKDTEAF